LGWFDETRGWLKEARVEDFDLYADEEEEAAEEEGANRTFIILVAAMGGVLILGICAFVAWALIGPRIAGDRTAQNQAIEATNTAVAAMAEAMEIETETTGVAPTDTATPLPTNIPPPTLTKPPTATPVSATATSEGEEVAQVPTATRRPTATPRSSGEGVPDTGIGALGGSALAVGLLFLLIVVRRMRRAM